MRFLPYAIFYEALNFVRRYEEFRQELTYIIRLQCIGCQNFIFIMLYYACIFVHKFLHSQPTQTQTQTQTQAQTQTHTHSHSHLHLGDGYKSTTNALELAAIGACRAIHLELLFETQHEIAQLDSMRFGVC